MAILQDRKVAIMALAVACASMLQAPLAVADSAKRSVCIESYRIDHTKVVNNDTVLFYMNDGKVWQNTLTAPCPTLKTNTEGFIYSPTDPGTQEICSNLQTIRVRDTGEVCLLGAFTPFAGDKAAAR